MRVVDRLGVVGKGKDDMTTQVSERQMQEAIEDAYRERDEQEQTAAVFVDWLTQADEDEEE